MTVGNMKKKLILLSSVALLCACTPTVTKNGNLLQDYQIADVVVGVHTKSDVLRLLGSPTTQAPFDNNVWYYIGQEREKHGILDPKIVKERIVVASFDDQGVLQSLKDEDGERLDIPFERDKTPTHGNDMSVVQQFLGNLGRFNPNQSTK